jgi:hypothetical protein
MTEVEICPAGHDDLYEITVNNPIGFEVDYWEASSFSLSFTMTADDIERLISQYLKECEE